ncbi:MAG: FKBP-type peptidyl-prolyl cis-trans isomerase [Desulfuromonadales bacterium]|nr:FKBP-type peptidyl-prolyl cis-trans isomerase [Desulfuromonadales bacterium]
MTASTQRRAQDGDRVRVTYVGRFADGTEFDSSEGHAPLEFTVGTGEVIPGFDQAVLGLSPGECRTVEVSPEDGYGAHLPEMVAEVERRQIPDEQLLEVGNYLEVRAQNGASFEVRIAALTETTVQLDANHPLAGKVLHFDVQFLEFA